MIASISIADPTAALMLAHLDVDDLGRVRAGRPVGLRRRQRRYQRQAKLRKLLA